MDSESGMAVYNTKKQNKNDFSSEHWRIYVLVFFIFALTVIIFFRLYSLQVLAHQKYRLLAQDQHQVLKTLTPKRGEVYLQEHDGLYPLAVNREFQMVYLVPKRVEDKEQVTYSLSSVLEMNEDEIRKKLADSEDVFEILQHKITEDQAAKIKELNLKGVKLMPETFRYYPGERLASQTIGFVGSDGDELKGRYGIEYYWEKELSGEPGVLNQERDAGGRWISISDRDLKPAKDGIDIELTMDHIVQYEVEKIMRETVEKHGADNGSAIVMDPNSGDVLAMANYPDFNPNNYGEVEDMSYYMNPVISGAYEAGSVFKTITMAAGLDTGKIMPDSTYVDTGQVNEAGYTIENSEEKVYGKQTMTQVLEESINTGVIHVEKLIGNKTFADYVKRFGFGSETGIELPGESAGNIKNLEYLKRDIQFFTASFGHGITMTPLQIANAYSAIANGGVLMKPQVIEKIIYPDGSEKIMDTREIRRVISKKSARQTGEMLRSVVVNGHGKRADVPGYLVGGKTGTAQVTKSGEKGYEEDITIGSFAGFAPVDDPKFTVVVKIYHPRDVEWAESTAAPAFQKIMKFLLEYYEVKPTEEVGIEQINHN